jgi:hypothetical protein
MAQEGGVSVLQAGSWHLVSSPIHEDLADICTILDSFQCPFFSTAPKIRATDVIHSWTVDTLPATALTGLVENADFSTAAGINTYPVRLANGTQTFYAGVQVSDRARSANFAGIRDLYEHQVMKGFKHLARQFEATTFAALTAYATGITGTTYNTMSNLLGLGISTASSASGAVTTADIVTLSQTLFNAGAEPDSMWFAPATKRQFVNATLQTGGGAGNVRNIAASDQRLVANVDVFETPFNQLYAVITDRFIPCTTSSAVGAYFIGDRAMAKVAFYRPPQHKPMGKTGDHTRGLLFMEATLQVDHPSSWHAMTGVTNG